MADALSPMMESIELSTAGEHTFTQDNVRPTHFPFDCLVLSDEDSEHYSRHVSIEISERIEREGLKVKYRERDGLAGENKLSFLSSSLCEVDTVICIITQGTTKRYDGDIGLVLKHPDKKWIIPILHGVKEAAVTTSALKSLLSINYSETTTNSHYMSNIINTLKRPRLGM